MQCGIRIGLRRHLDGMPIERESKTPKGVSRLGFCDRTAKQMGGDAMSGRLLLGVVAFIGVVIGRQNSIGIFQGIRREFVFNAVSLELLIDLRHVLGVGLGGMRRIKLPVRVHGYMDHRVSFYGFRDFDLMAVLEDKGHVVETETNLQCVAALGKFLHEVVVRRLFGFVGLLLGLRLLGACGQRALVKRFRFAGESMHVGVDTRSGEPFHPRGECLFSRAFGRDFVAAQILIGFDFRLMELAGMIMDLYQHMIAMHRDIWIPEFALGNRFLRRRLRRRLRRGLRGGFLGTTCAFAFGAAGAFARSTSRFRRRSESESSMRLTRIRIAEHHRPLDGVVVAIDRLDFVTQETLCIGARGHSAQSRQHRVIECARDRDRLDTCAWCVHRVHTASSASRNRRASWIITALSRAWVLPGALLAASPSALWAPASVLASPLSASPFGAVLPLTTFRDSVSLWSSERSFSGRSGVLDADGLVPSTSEVGA